MLSDIAERFRELGKYRKFLLNDQIIDHRGRKIGEGLELRCLEPVIFGQSLVDFILIGLVDLKHRNHVFTQDELEHIQLAGFGRERIDLLPNIEILGEQHNILETFIGFGNIGEESRLSQALENF